MCLSSEGPVPRSLIKIYKMFQPEQDVSCKILYIFIPQRRALEVLNDKIKHHLSHMLEQRRIRYPMPRLRIQHQFKLLPCLL